MINIRRFIEQDIGCVSIADCIVIVTENVDGEPYLLVSDTIYTILDDWEGECEYVPENEAPVYLAAGEGVAYPSHLRNFEQLMEYFRMLRHEDC